MSKIHLYFVCAVNSCSPSVLAQAPAWSPLILQLDQALFAVASLCPHHHVAHLQSLLVQCLSSDSEALEVSSCCSGWQSQHQRSYVGNKKLMCGQRVAPTQACLMAWAGSWRELGWSDLKRKLLLEPIGDEKLWTRAWHRVEKRAWLRRCFWGCNQDLTSS